MGIWNFLRNFLCWLVEKKEIADAYMTITDKKAKMKKINEHQTKNKKKKYYLFIHNFIQKKYTNA